MAASWRFAAQPPAFWEACCREQNDLFNTVDWQRLLGESFGCRTLYAWRDEARACVISVFPVGPLRIGYSGFPVGGGLGGGAILDQQALYQWRRASLPVTIHAFQLDGRGFLDGVVPDGVGQLLPTTALVHLQNWQPHALPKVRRVVNKARHSDLTIREAGADEGDVMYGLYRQMIRRHRGHARYNRAYFRRLAALGCRHGGLRCLLAWRDARPAGFHVVACHGSRAYYLHGGSDPALRSLYPADLLFLYAIEWARQVGMEVFDMLASPADQPSLVRYKEKWGGVTTLNWTYTEDRIPGCARLMQILRGVQCCSRRWLAKGKSSADH